MSNIGYHYEGQKDKQLDQEPNKNGRYLGNNNKIYVGNGCIKIDKKNNGIENIKKKFSKTNHKMVMLDG